MKRTFYCQVWPGDNPLMLATTNPSGPHPGAKMYSFTVDIPCLDAEPLEASEVVEVVDEETAGK